MPGSATTLFRSSTMTIEPAWIDYNDHMNLAYYHVLFDRACDELWERLGLGADYARDRQMTTYAAESHVCYVREVRQGDPVFSTAVIVDHDEKRIHLYQELFHADGWLSATLEVLSLSIDRNGPKVAPFPADIAAAIAAQAEIDAQAPRPARLGRRITINRKA